MLIAVFALNGSDYRLRVPFEPDPTVHMEFAARRALLKTGACSLVRVNDWRLVSISGG